ncbi:hypothetical protein [Spiroplasma ixodetis]|uniref:Uncharacterized protein n=1 Tax=Spiroplasma ixodetis TaxID=2141 RepID=A0ABM8BVY7_9MOLU|nr:hypothetical protein [Spiroplasma ixodetis]BDT03834.1 hypothetical protein SHM_14800 [Spiroplasma ixodetis]
MSKNLNKWGRKTITFNEFQNKKCQFKSCEENIFSHSLDLNYFKKMISEHLTNLNKAFLPLCTIFKSYHINAEKSLSTDFSPHF